MKRNEIAEQARQYIGCNWVHQGRVPEIGIDCLGVLVLIAHHFGYAADKDVHDYKRNPVMTEDEQSTVLIEGLRDNFKEIPVKEAGEGDVMTFTMPGDGGLPRHVGIVVRGRRELHLVHSLMNKKTLEEPLKKWLRFATHAFRFIDLEDE